MDQNKLNTCLSFLIEESDVNQQTSSLSDEEIDQCLTDDDFKRSLVVQTLINDALNQHLPNRYDPNFSIKVMQKIHQELANNLQTPETVPLPETTSKAPKNDAFYKKTSTWASAVFVILGISAWMLTAVQKPAIIAKTENQPPVSITATEQIASTTTIQTDNTPPKQSEHPIPLQIAGTQTADAKSKLDQPLPEGEWEKRLSNYLDRYREETGNGIIPYTRPASYNTNNAK